ncbi:RNA polymerase II subunit A C-terminal domain phosphatase [Pancytospora epiphaga]|nr:RNA polymerase II subunit A C-terminal domain phosphatase [Pancytospora epiphaga]
MVFLDGLSKEAADNKGKRPENEVLTNKDVLERNVDFRKGVTPEACPHTLRIGILCAICGKNMENDKSLVVAALHASDEILQTTSSALLEQQIKNEVLNKRKKLILILDLDQTILHTTTTESPCDVKFSIEQSMFYVKYRPYLIEFLNKIKELFEIHVYTMGAREYASQVCGFIDPTGKLFGGRIVSRNENFNELTKSLERITCIDKNVVILDDRMDVWNYSRNLLPVRPFWYYNHLDINDPHLVAMERDEESSTAIGNSTVSPDFIEEDTGSITEDVPGSNIGDCELPVLYSLLQEIHSIYFSKGISVPEIIKLSFLQGLFVISSPIYRPIIEFLGGTVSGMGPKVAIEDHRSARLFKIPNVRSEWLYESLYNRVLADVNDFIIKDYRDAQATDEYENELLEEFFGN